MNTSLKDESYYEEIRRCNRILKKFPDNNHVLKRRASWHFWHEDWKKAARDYEELAKRMPDNEIIWSMLGQACVHGRLPEKAVEACSRSIELAPVYLRPYMHRGWAYRQLKQWELSISDYTKAIELDMKWRPTMHAALYRAMLYMEMKLYEKAVDDLTLAISRSPVWHKLFDLRGQAYIKLKQYEKVIENAKAFMEAAELSYVPFREQLTIAYKKLGLKKEKSVDREIAYLEAQNRLCPEAFKSFRQGILYEESGKYEEAITYLYGDIASLIPNLDYRDQLSPGQMIRKMDSEISQNPDNAAMYVIRGKALWQMTEYEKAVSDFTRAIELQPNMVIAYVFRRYAYSRIMNCDTTALQIADLTKAVKLDDTISFLHEELAKLYKENGQYRKAIKHFNKALMLAPLMSLIYLDRSETHEAIQDYRAAIDDLNSYLDSIPGNRKGAEWLAERRGDLFCQMGEHVKALEDYSEAIKYEQKFNSDSKRRLADLFEKRGKCNGALNREAKAKADFFKATKLRQEGLRIYEWFNRETDA